MISLFSGFGKILDHTRLNLQGKERFEEINKHFNKSLGGLGFVFIALVLSIICGGWVWYSGTHPTPARFYMLSPPQELVESNNSQISQQSVSSGQQRIYEVNTSLSPRMSTNKVQSWVSRSLMDLYTFNFINADEHLEKMSIVFRPDTFTSFMNEMNRRDGILDTIKDSSLIVSLTPASEVRVIKQGITGSTRVWLVEQRVLIYYSGALSSPPPPQSVLFTIMLQEAPPSKNPYGLYIVQIKQGVSS